MLLGDLDLHQRTACRRQGVDLPLLNSGDVRGDARKSDFPPTDSY